MATMVVRVMVDADGRLTPEIYEAGLRQLRSDGHEVIASPASRLADTNREIELILEGDELDDVVSTQCVAACESAFGTEATLGVVTYVSRGTDDDARGVLRRFRVDGDVVRTHVRGEDVVTVTIARADLRRVPESRLHTALEAALNAEVRIVVS